MGDLDKVANEGILSPENNLDVALNTLADCDAGAILNSGAQLDEVVNTEKAIHGGASNVEDDLDDLLDSALNDFDKPLPKVKVTASSSSNAESHKEKDSTSNESNQWSNEFQKFQDAMEAFLKENSDTHGSDESSSATASNDLSASLAETLKAIADSAQCMNEPSPDELAQLFKSMGLEDSDNLKPDQIPDIMPLMQNVMQSLLSKELLYPALKDIVNKYPDWLAEKQPTLDEEAFRKYSSQYELMKQVCEEFETTDNTSKEAKSQSFEKILMLMQKMQECGNPPKELIGDMPADLPFDESGNAKIPGMAEQCKIM